MQNTKIKLLKFNEFEFTTYPLIRIKKKEIKDLPDVLTNKIFYYLSHPCADIIRQHVNLFKDPMFGLKCVSIRYRMRGSLYAKIHIEKMGLDLDINETCTIIYDMYVQTYIQNRRFMCDCCDIQFLHEHEPYATIMYQDNGENAYACEKCMI